MSAEPNGVRREVKLWDSARRCTTIDLTDPVALVASPNVKHWRHQLGGIIAEPGAGGELL